jgi:hypothetical protein
MRREGIRRSSEYLWLKPNKKDKPLIDYSVINKKLSILLLEEKEKLVD